MPGLMKVACFVVACMIVAGPITAKAALSCAVVSSNLAQCIGYLSRGEPIRAACCSGVRIINSLARTPSDRQLACLCLKTLANALPTLNADSAAGLPVACGINLPYKIGKSTNCTLVG